MLPAAIGGTGGQRPRHLRLLPGGAAPARPRPRPCRLPARLLILGPSFPGHRERGASLPALPGRPAVPGGRRAGGGKRFQDRGQAGSSKPCCLPTGDINTVWEGKKIKNQQNNPEMGSASQEESALHFGRRHPPNLCCQKLH